MYFGVAHLHVVLGGPDGRTGQVTLPAVVHPSVVDLLVSDDAPVTATSEARAQRGR